LTTLPYPSTSHADPRALERHVRFITENRRAGAPEYIADAFRASGAAVVEQAFVVRKQTFRNVIATFGPDDSKSPLIVIGAHYDAFNDLPAADDNASGTAGLLELARLLGTTKPARPIVLVAYANEEPPYFASENMGSYVHAASVERRKVDAMISLEMIGYFGHEQLWHSWVLSLIYGRRGDFIGVAGGWHDRDLTRLVKRSMSEVRAVSFTGPHSMLDASDQRNYWSRGWHAVMVTDTAYERNLNYHTIHDTADTLDYRRMAAVVDGVFAACFEMGTTGARSPEAPSSSSFEMTEQRAAFSPAHDQFQQNLEAVRQAAHLCRGLLSAQSGRKGRARRAEWGGEDHALPDDRRRGIAGRRRGLRPEEDDHRLLPAGHRRDVGPFGSR